MRTSPKPKRASEDFMNPCKKKVWVTILAVLIAVTLCVIFGNSLKGPDESKKQSDAVGDLLRPIIDPEEKLTEEEFSFLVRKSGHFVEYAILGAECAVLAFLLCGGLTPLVAICPAFGCLLMADVDEFIQSFTDRGSKVADVFIDFGGAVTGIAVGFALAYAVRYIYRRRIRTER